MFYCCMSEVIADRILENFRKDGWIRECCIWYCDSLEHVIIEREAEERHDLSMGCAEGT
jgi:hypothetical protein